MVFWDALEGYGGRDAWRVNYSNGIVYSTAFSARNVGLTG